MRCVVLTLLLAVAASCSQATVAEPLLPEAPALLWSDGNPGGWQADRPEEQILGGDGVLRIAHVEQPTLQYFPPARGVATQPVAVILCPGGGYRILAINKEGSEVAELLAANGFHAFVLKYRLPNSGEQRFRPGLEDTLRATRMVRARADELGIESVGMLGFSAGGHLAATTVAQVDHRLDFVSLVYPAYFLRDRTSSELVREVQLGEEPVPAFLVHALNDGIPARNSVIYAEQLSARKIPAELHLYARGGHGFGLTQAGKLPVGDWPEHWMNWLRRRTPAR